MSILNRIRDKLLGLIVGVEQKVDEVKEHFEERRAKTMEEKLEALAAKSPYKNWRKSSEDLAYLVELDGSPEGRAELWKELGLKGAYKRTGPQNEQLHAALMEWLATTGNVPRLVYE